MNMKHMERPSHATLHYYSPRSTRNNAFIKAYSPSAHHFGQILPFSPKIKGPSRRLPHSPSFGFTPATWRDKIQGV
ncbi:unnamed protein product [Prunus armeniaca]|uniref:Uncharacterized protein n=1 Tax=Prunus armeniaca TaxID=36596 RepID=A0A6J5UZ23_PRUAR|nr:unnamed protein product [Prunus armeniaca]